ncbi:MAG: hypothetical protein JWL71_510 [Acidobacteria bacterium]|nr:hypothetical protein [Acidobacteriota bacterium]
MKMRKLYFAAVVLVAPALLASPVSASSILGSNLASFAVLGATTVTNVPTSKISGSVGDWNGGANTVVGFCVSPGSPCTDPQVTGGTVQAGTLIAQLAQAELTTAINDLNSLAPGQLEPADLTGLTLAPGVYRVPFGSSNLTGTLTLDGGNNANAAWVFLMDSSLITSVGSTVNVVGTGAGAGVYWDVRSSATLNTGSTFEGNILALTSITMGDGVTIGCGRALASTGDVTLISDTISIGCAGTLAGSNGLGGGLTVTPGGGVQLLPAAPVPEPGSLMLLSSGLLWVGRSVRRQWKR